MEKVAFECLVLGCRYRSENKVGHPRGKGSCFLRQKGRNKAGSLQLLRVVVRPCWIPAGLDTMLKNLVIGPQTEESGKAMKGNTRTETALGKWTWLQYSKETSQKAAGRNTGGNSCPKCCPGKRNYSGCREEWCPGTRAINIKEGFLRLGWNKMCFENFKTPPWDN